jgi:hypothetical protein
MSRRGRPAASTAPASRGGGVLRIVAVLGVLGLALLTGVLLAGWIWMGLVVKIPLRDQYAGITLPERFDAVVEVNNPLDVAMKGEITAAVPFQQTLTVPLRGRYDFDVEMDARVPVQFEVRFDGVIPVATEAEVTIRTGINYKNLKSLRNLVIETTLPLRFPLPVSLNIPVDDVIDLTYAGPLSADIDQDLLAPVDTVLRTRLPIDQTIRTPVTAAIPLEVRLDPGQVRMIITELLVALRPSRMLGIGLASQAAREAGPQRVANPYGPLDPGPWPPPEPMDGDAQAR